MTTPDNNQPELIGNLILRHKENRTEMRELEQQFSKVAAQINQLNGMVRDGKDTIHNAHDGFRTGFNNTTVPYGIADSLREIVTNLQETRAERDRIETCMRSVGLDEYINPGERETRTS